jgi:hypothetical protein
LPIKLIEPQDDGKPITSKVIKIKWTTTYNGQFILSFGDHKKPEEAE